MESPTDNSNNNSISSQSTITSDSVYIFGYSGEVNEKRHLKFNDNDFVNVEFLRYITLCNNKGSTYNSRVRKLKLRVQLESITSKKLCFYSEENYKELKDMIKSFNVIKSYVNFHYKRNDDKIDYVNDSTLLLQPINSIDYVISLKIDKKIYRFSTADIIQIYNHALKHVDQKAYINGGLEAPKNPYTNIDFTFIQNLSIYTQLLQYFKNVKGFIPNYLVGFKECYFDTKDYFARYYNNLMNTSVMSYLKNCSDETFEEEFDDMVSNLSPVIRGSYCAKCYKKHNIRLMFLDAVKAYILNSNEIFLYGYHETIFLAITEANNLNFKPDHRLRHRKRIRGRRPRSARITNRYSSSGNSTFNFTPSSESLYLQNLQTNFANTFRSSSSLFTDNTLFNTDFSLVNNRITDNILLNILDTSSPINPVYNPNENIRFSFNSPLNSLEVGVSNIVDDIGAITNSLEPISQLRLLTNEPYDATIDLTMSDSSIETPPISPNNESTHEVAEESIENC
tara:strand:- start:437 stop:1963 length:1527 start_codon:yes stop_codon:yes gene_type:complete